MQYGSSSSGVSAVCPLRMRPIFRWSRERQKQPYRFTSRWARAVFHVWDAPAMRMTMALPPPGAFWRGGCGRPQLHHSTGGTVWQSE